MAAVIALALRPEHAAAPMPVPSLQAIAGTGLAGDRHADPLSPRQLLLAGRPAYEELGLQSLSLRENLLLDVDTAGLSSGTLLRVGADVVLRVSFQCEACGQLDLQRPGLARAIGLRRGVLARVVRGGLLHAGDPVQVLEERMPAMPEDWRERVLRVMEALPTGMVIDYAQLARLAGVQSSYCRAFPNLLARHGLAGKAVPARSPDPAPRWMGAGLFD